MKARELTVSKISPSRAAFELFHPRWSRIKRPRASERSPAVAMGMMRQMDELRLDSSKNRKIEETGQDKHRLIGKPLRWMNILLSGMRYRVIHKSRSYVVLCWCMNHGRLGEWRSRVHTYIWVLTNTAQASVAMLVINRARENRRIGMHYRHKVTR